MSSASIWRRPGRPSCRPEPGELPASSYSPALLATLLLAGCTGIFGHPLPEYIAAFEQQGRGQILVGAAEVDITPTKPQYMAGFGLARRSTGVHTPLKVRALVLLQEEEEEGNMRVAIVGIDNLGLERPDSDWIKAAIPGFQNGAIFLCASHTHAAPDLVGLWGFYFLSSGRDPAYAAQVRDGIARAVAEARRRARPARLYYGTARMPAKGFVHNTNRPGLFNRRLTVLHARGLADSKPLGTLLHMACHPEMLKRDNTLLSSDFAGDLCDRWRDSGLGQAIFVNGELGAMITPAHRPREAKAVPDLGKKLMAVAERALASAFELEATEIEVRRRDVYLPLSSPALGLGRLTMAIQRELYGGCLRSTVGYLRLGRDSRASPAFEAVAVPGEMEPALAARIRQRLSRPGLVVFGLVDDEVGYLLRQVDANDRLYAYERLVSPGPGAGELVERALVGGPRLPGQ